MGRRLACWAVETAASAGSRWKQCLRVATCAWFAVAAAAAAAPPGPSAAVPPYTGANAAALRLQHMGHKHQLGCTVTNAPHRHLAVCMGVQTSSLRQ